MYKKMADANAKPRLASSPTQDQADLAPHTTILQEDVELYDSFDADGRWTDITTARHHSANAHHTRPEEQADDHSETAPDRSTTLTATVSAAVGTTQEYLLFATKFLALEAVRDVGWVTSTQTATAIVENVTRRFPLLQDLQRAYWRGQRLRSSNSSSLHSSAASSMEVSRGNHHLEGRHLLARMGDQWRADMDERRQPGGVAGGDGLPRSGSVDARLVRAEEEEELGGLREKAEVQVVPDGYYSSDNEDMEELEESDDSEID